MKTAVLSMDVEDWFHLDYFDRSDCNRAESFLDGMMSYARLIEEHGLKSTFFVLGELAKPLKNELNALAEAGHEIACHGWDHKRPLTMDPDAFSADVRKAKAALEDVIQKPVIGYRAPCFSLDRERLERLVDAGFQYDSSRILFGDHPLYGTLDVNEFEERIDGVFQRAHFFEFQVSTLSVGRRELPISGGGYLRIFPWILTRQLLRRYLPTASFYTLYIHPFELSARPNPNLPDGTRFRTRCRFSVGRKRVISKLSRLILLLEKYDYQFKTFEQTRGRWINP